MAQRNGLFMTEAVAKYIAYQQAQQREARQAFLGAGKEEDEASAQTIDNLRRYKRTSRPARTVNPLIFGTWLKDIETEVRVWLGSHRRDGSALNIRLLQKKAAVAGAATFVATSAISGMIKPCRESSTTMVAPVMPTQALIQVHRSSYQTVRATERTTAKHGPSEDVAELSPYQLGAGTGPIGVN